MRTMAILLLLAFAPLATAEEDGESVERYIKDQVNDLTSLKTGDDREVAIVLGREYLKCAALFENMSRAIADERPALSKLYAEKRNWYLVVGTALITKPGEALRSNVSVVEAYIESYRLDTLPGYSTAGLKLVLKNCRRPGFLERGDEIIAALQEPSG